MNWKRGFLGLWIVGSVFWLIAVSWTAYSSVLSPRMTAPAEDACFQAATKRKHGRNPFDCFKEGVRFDSPIALRSQLAPYLLWAFVPVLLSFGLGLIALSILSGFAV